MRSIKKILITAIILVLTTIALNKVSYFIYEPYRNLNVIRRIELEEENGKIEVAICGTSLAMNGFDVEVFDEKLGLNTFNFATSKQDLESTYYLLEQLVQDNPLKIVCLNVSGATLKENDSEAENYVRKKTVWDAYYNTKTKFRHFFDLYSMKEYEKALMYFYDVHDSNLISLEKIEDNIYYKRHLDELMEKKPKKYTTKGHISNERNIKAGTSPQAEYIETKSHDAEEINADNVKFLNKILTLCEDNGIRMVMVTTPPSPTLNKLLENREEMYEYYTNLAKQYDAEYYYYEDAELEEIYDDSYYFEWSHVNKHGAAILSNDMCDWLLEEGK